MMDGVQTMIYTVHSVHIYIYICCYVIRSLVKFLINLYAMLKNDENFLTLCTHSVKFLANLEWFHTRIDV